MKSLLVAAFTVVMGWVMTVLSFSLFVFVAGVLLYVGASLSLYGSQGLVLIVMGLTALGAILIGGYLAVRTGLGVAQWTRSYGRETYWLILLGGVGIVLYVFIAFVGFFGW